MTFYQEQIIKINRDIYPKDYLCQQVLKAKQFIDTNFANNINLNDIAAEALFSKFHFIRLFKTMYGRTPHHGCQPSFFIRNQRMLKLVELKIAIPDK